MSEKCIITIHGQQYDVSSFLEEHPGGADILKDLHGKDATKDFEDVGHSKVKSLTVNVY
jgi:cytochrome b involved in lipid metabolism